MTEPDSVNTTTGLPLYTSISNTVTHELSTTKNQESTFDNTYIIVLATVIPIASIAVIAGTIVWVKKSSGVKSQVSPTGIELSQMRVT